MKNVKPMTNESNYSMNDYKAMSYNNIYPNYYKSYQYYPNFNNMPIQQFNQNILLSSNSTLNNMIQNIKDKEDKKSVNK